MSHWLFCISSQYHALLLQFFFLFFSTQCSSNVIWRCPTQCKPLELAHMMTWCEHRVWERGILTFSVVWQNLPAHHHHFHHHFHQNEKNALNDDSQLHSSSTMNVLSLHSYTHYLFVRYTWLKLIYKRFLKDNTKPETFYLSFADKVLFKAYSCVQSSLTAKQKKNETKNKKLS